MATVSVLDTDRDYPTSDGKPMAETDEHRKVAVDLIDVLEHRYRDRADVYVSGDLLIFYEPGNKKRHVAPDVFVCFDVENRLRPNYLIWREGKGPDVIIEVTSKTTRNEDRKTKHPLLSRRFGRAGIFPVRPVRGVFVAFDARFSAGGWGISADRAGERRVVKRSAGGSLDARGLDLAADRHRDRSTPSPLRRTRQA